MKEKKDKSEIKAFSVNFVKDISYHYGVKIITVFNLPCIRQEFPCQSTCQS